MALIGNDSAGRARFNAILVGGLAAATLDILYASSNALLDGRLPTRMLQAIASGWHGAAAYEGGAAMAWLGLASHYAILMMAAAIFVFASVRMPWLRRQWLAAGVLFGCVVWVVMHEVVVPLSAAPFTMPHTPAFIAETLLVHIVLVGLPIAFAARRFLGR